MEATGSAAEGRLHALVAQTFDVYDVGDAYRVCLGLAWGSVVLTFRGLRVSGWAAAQPERSGAVRGSAVGRYQRPCLPPAGLHESARPDAWFDEAGASVEDPAVLERLRRLAIPPAWVEVWASADSEASVQATGVDQRGRTQYRYSPAAQHLASDYKFARMTLFAAAIPALRLQVASDIAQYRQDPLGARS
jgi:hypothetical protein